MNTYSKYQPNVFLAKCSEQHEKGETITLTTKYNQEHECIVFNLILKRDGFFYYSIVRADGFNAQEYAKRKADRIAGWASNAEKKSTEFYNRSNKDSAFLSLGEPIKVGHHSERRHRKIIQEAHNNMGKSVELSNKAAEYESRAEYWESRANIINLSMPESIEYFEYKLEGAKQLHEGLKNGTIERRHSFSLTYAKKDVKELENKVHIAKLLWA